MKSKFLKLNKACSESWENMKPNEKGSFCDTCSKNVIDFTQLSSSEILEKIKKSKGEICARLTKNQLETPLFDLEVQKKYRLPYANAAASLLIASTLTIGQTAHADTVKVQTEFVQTSDATSNSDSKEKKSTPNTTSSNGFITFKGKVKSEQNGTLIKNAKITLVTVQKMLTTYSKEDGSFSLKIPVELIDNDNVVRVSYDKVENKDDDRVLTSYGKRDYVLSKKEISANYTIKAQGIIYALGGIGHNTEEKNPIIIQNQKRVAYADFKNAQRGKKTSCNLENQDYYYFEPKAAMAIYGKEAEAGLLMLIDKPKKK